MQVYKTPDYEMFYMENNRELVDAHVEKLMKSIREHDHTASHPIIVFPQDEKGHRIFNGQHRFEACKRLGLPIYYLVDETASEDSLITTQTSRKWSTHDMLSHRARTSAPHAELLRMVDELELKSSFHMLYKNDGGPTEFKPDLHMARAQKRYAVLSTLKRSCQSMAHHKIFTTYRGKMAILLLADAGADMGRFADRLNQAGQSIQITDSLSFCVDQVFSFYNHKLHAENRIEVPKSKKR